MRQIRNRLSTSDWLFLNACLGVVNDDASAVRAYLRQEGDRARQLTKEECLVLGQPSTFTVGGTLPHLAIRCYRVWSILVDTDTCTSVFRQPLIQL